MHPLKLLFMGALLNAIGSNVQSLANGALSSLIGGSISSHFNKSMMRYQDQLNDQNALDAYNRQRELMGDAASLQKQGMLKAGYNTAFGSNGSVMSAGSSQMSSVGQSGMGNNMPNSFQTMLDAKDTESNAKVADSHSRLLDRQAEGQSIENDYKAANAIADLSNKAANTRDSNAKAHLNEIKANLENKWGDRAYGAAVGKAESDASAAVDNAAIVGLNRQILQATYPDKVAYAHELLENEKKKGKLLDAQVIVENGIPRIQESEIAKNYASADESRTHSALNVANTASVNEQTKGYKLNNEYLSKTLTDRVNKQGYDTLISKIATLPHSYRDVVMRSHQWQVMCYKLEHNQQLSQQELKNLDELLRLDTYDPNKNASNWINFVKSMK
jgi:hypothetical protein